MILSGVDLQPHRTRYWRTARIDAEFKRRAEKVLWCYANADRLAKRGYWVVCADEKPNCQVLERRPIRRSIPGSIEQQEFEYNRLYAHPFEWTWTNLKMRQRYAEHTT